MELHVVSSVNCYRGFVQKHVTDQDRVLEVGCSSGGTTRLLGCVAARVLAVDHSAEMVEETRTATEGMASVVVRQYDVRELVQIQAEMPSPTVVFFDVGGDTRVDKVLALLRPCLLRLRPRLWVVRSIELAAISSQITEVEAPKESPLLAAPPLRPVDHRERAIPELLELSQSPSANDRLFAARRLRTFRETPAVAARLEEMLEDPSARVQKLLRAMLKR